MIIARQSTARTVTVGPVLDAGGVAVTNGVVGDFKIAKNGGAPAALNGSATLTHRNTGHYSLALTSSDLDTVGQAEIVIDDTVNACPMKEITVVEEAVYDALFAASAAGYSTLDAAGIRTAVGLASANLDTQLSTIDSNVDSVLADTGTDGVIVATNNDKTGYSIGAGGIGASAFAAGAINAAAIDADAIGASELASDAVTEIASGVFSRTFSSAYNSHTFDELVKLMAATLLGKVSGMATTEVRFRNLSDGADVVIATVDADGNRSAVTRTP